MTRKQLRPFYTCDEMAALYLAPYDHTRWADHLDRVERTIVLASQVITERGLASGMDLAAGDGAILRALPLEWKMFGDWRERQIPEGEGWSWGNVEAEETWAAAPGHDLHICTEILEHVEDPDLLLRRIRHRAQVMILSTPAWEMDSANPEHYWGWGVDDVREMLVAAGFTRFQLSVWDLGVLGGHPVQTWVAS